MPDQFHLVTSFTPAGDQPQAIRQLVGGVRAHWPLAPSPECFILKIPK